MPIIIKRFFYFVGCSCYDIGELPCSLDLYKTVEAFLNEFRIDSFLAVK